MGAWTLRVVDAEPAEDLEPLVDRKPETGTAAEPPVRRKPETDADVVVEASFPLEDPWFVEDTDVWWESDTIPISVDDGAFRHGENVIDLPRR